MMIIHVGADIGRITSFIHLFMHTGHINFIIFSQNNNAEDLHIAVNVALFFFNLFYFTFKILYSFLGSQHFISG